MSRLFPMVILLLSLSSQLLAAAPSVPFVGCPADGQTGPVQPPQSDNAAPTVPSEIQPKLSNYASTDLAVLAPRGWHCFESYGSNGATLWVTPSAIGAQDLPGNRLVAPGPAIVISRIYGGTSGRFTVAKIVARVFPSSWSYARGVIAEKIEPERDFVFQPFPADILIRRGPNLVEFTTPADDEGLGTFHALATSRMPVTGVAILSPEDDMNLVMLDVRLPPELQSLASTIVGSVEQDAAAKP